VLGKLFGRVLGELLEQRLQLGVCGVAGHARLQQNVDDVPAARACISLRGRKTSALYQVHRGAATPTMTFFRSNCNVCHQNGPISEEVHLHFPRFECSVTAIPLVHRQAIVFELDA
jgi:hypothetical protein